MLVTSLHKRRVETVQRIVRRCSAIHLGHVIGVHRPHTDHGFGPAALTGEYYMLNEHVGEQDGEEFQEAHPKSHQPNNHDVILEHLHKRVDTAVRVDALRRIDLLEQQQGYKEHGILNTRETEKLIRASSQGALLEPQKRAFETRGGRFFPQK